MTRTRNALRREWPTSSVARADDDRARSNRSITECGGPPIDAVGASANVSSARRHGSGRPRNSGLVACSHTPAVHATSWNIARVSCRVASDFRPPLWSLTAAVQARNPARDLFMLLCALYSGGHALAQTTTQRAPAIGATRTQSGSRHHLSAATPYVSISSPLRGVLRRERPRAAPLQSPRAGSEYGRRCGRR